MASVTALGTQKPASPAPVSAMPSASPRRRSKLAVIGRTRTIGVDPTPTRAMTKYDSKNIGKLDRYRLIASTTAPYENRLSVPTAAAP